MTHEERKRWEDRQRERRNINTYAPLEELEKIAQAHVPELRMKLGRAQNGLDTMGSDELDFFEISVWGLKEALIEAYLLGRKGAEANLQRQIYNALTEAANGYTPTCPRGYYDCVRDPAYIKHHYPVWYKKLYGDKTPEEAAREPDGCFDRFKKDPDEKYYCYDDEDK